ncbi:MAG: hypothetical protein WC867_03370 [Candidatus Pacearchaeota archaeon]
MTIFIVGPLVFVGACFPLGLFGFTLSEGGSSEFFGMIIFYGSWIVGLGLGILVVFYLIKLINKKYG